MDCGFLNDYAYLSTRPNYIGLAHELIHADRDLRGVTEGNMVEYKPFNAKQTLEGRKRYGERIDGGTREEYATVGLYYTNPGDITENMIRTEHGLRKRGAYVEHKK